MTLKELVTSVDFNSLLPYLKNIESVHLDNIYAFREAYDILRNIEPNRDFEGEIHVEWGGGEEFEEKWIGVYHLDDDYWENELSKEIIIADDINITMEELAAKCLWEITFYGFSPVEIKRTFDNMLNRQKLCNKYEIALDKLQESIWKHQTPRKYRGKSNGQRYTDAFYSLKKIENNRMNRSKRKREYRQNNREKYLKRMCHRERLINTLTPNDGFQCDDIEFLFDVKYGVKYSYISVTSEKRLDYILESMTKYQQVDLSKYDCAIICVYTSSLYPLSQKESDNFELSVRSHFGYDKIFYGTVITEENCREIKVIVSLNKL